MLFEEIRRKLERGVAVVFVLPSEKERILRCLEVLETVEKRYWEFVAETFRMALSQGYDPFRIKENILTQDLKDVSVVEPETVVKCVNYLKQKLSTLFEVDLPVDVWSWGVVEKKYRIIFRKPITVNEDYLEKIGLPKEFV